MEHVSNVWTDDQGVVRLECLSCGPLDPSGYHSPVVVSRTRDAATVEQLAGAWAQHLAEAVEDTDSGWQAACEGIHAALAAIPLPANYTPEETRRLLLGAVRMFDRAAGQ